MRQHSFSVKLPPTKLRNALRRSREYLTADEVAQLVRATRRQGRYKQRNTTLILLMYRHGLRVAELVRLRWDMFDLKTALFHVQRVKNGVPSLHPLRGAELRALRQLQSTTAGGAYLFVSERGGPLTARAVHHIVAGAGRAAGLPFPVHPHMLRHACGFYLVATNIIALPSWKSRVVSDHIFLYAGVLLPYHHEESHAWVSYATSNIG